MKVKRTDKTKPRKFRGFIQKIESRSFVCGAIGILYAFTNEVPVRDASVETW